MLLTSFLSSPPPIPPVSQPIPACSRTVATNSSAHYNSTVVTATATATIHTLQPHKNKNGLDSKIHQLEFSAVLTGYELCILRLALSSFYAHKISRYTAFHMTPRKFFENILKMSYKDNLYIQLIKQLDAQSNRERNLGLRERKKEVIDGLKRIRK